MSEPLKCMNHLETDEADFFCHLARDHEGYHQFDGTINYAFPGPVLRRDYTVRWQDSMIVTPITHKEG